MLKITLVGAGSYVFGSALLDQLLNESTLDDLDLHLVDPNLNALQKVCALGERFARLQGKRARFTSHRSWLEALKGSQFVVCLAAVEMRPRYQMDIQIIRTAYPGHLISEFGGVHGFASSLRQIGLVRNLCEDMRRECPQAELLMLSNPLSRTCQAAHEEGIRTVGFCSASLCGFGKLSEILLGKEDHYPFAIGRDAYQVTMAGTNHLSWLIELRSKSGDNLMPQLQSCLERRRSQSISEFYGRHTGHLPMSGDDHIQDFLPPERTQNFGPVTRHANDCQRMNREWAPMDTAQAIVTTEASMKNLLWERPFDYVAARLGIQRAEFTSLNLPNDGQISNLPKGAFVETSATVDGQIAPKAVTLPASVLPFSLSAVVVTKGILQAERNRSLRVLRDACEKDPTIVDKERGWAALLGCLEVHRDLLGTYH